MDKEQAAFYKKVKDFLIDHGLDPTTPLIVLNSGDNSVIMQGELAGYSLRYLKEYFAGMEGKQIEYDYED